MKTGLAAILFIAACTSSSNNGPACGDGVLDSGEQCDDGNTVSGDGCSSTCTTEAPANVCGDGTVGGTEQCDDGNTTSGDGCSKDCRHEYSIAATWDFKSTSVSGSLNCPNGYDTAAVYSQEVDATGAAIGQPTIDLFTCSDKQGTAAHLPSGHYDVWIAITTTTNSMTWGQSVDAAVDLTTANATYASDLYIDGGYFAWKWQLVGASSGNMLSCADAGVDGADLATTLVNSGNPPVADTFSCTDGQGVTGVLPAGSYAVSASALDANMGRLGSAVNQTATINIKNAVTNLGTIQLPVDGK